MEIWTLFSFTIQFLTWLFKNCADVSSFGDVPFFPYLLQFLMDAFLMGWFINKAAELFVPFL